MGRQLIIWSLKDLCDVIEGWVANKFDGIIFIEGKRGLGKSTLAYKICTRVKLPIPFIPKRDIVYSRDDTLKHLATKKGGVIFSDELINVAYNRDFYNEEQKVMLKALNMYRDSCNVFIGCIPSFIELDKQIQRLCKIRITIVRRGIALIHTQIPSIYKSDSWDIKTNEKIENAWTSKGMSKPRYAQLTTIRGILRFGDLTHEQREEYEGIKAEKRNRVFANYTDDSLIMDSEKLFYKNLLEQIKGGKVTPDSFEMIAKINNKKGDEVRRKINLMLKDLGEEKRWKDYVVSEKKRERMDKLGFKIQTREPIITPIPQQQEGGEEQGDEQKDIFGFDA